MGSPSGRKERDMLAINDIVVPAEFRAEPDMAESYSRVVEASVSAARAAAGKLDLVGPLVDGLIAIGVDEHIATPCGDGLVWRFGQNGSGRVRFAWTISRSEEHTSELQSHVNLVCR